MSVTEGKPSNGKPDCIPGISKSWILEGSIMSMGTILLVILILMLVGAFPTWPHSKGWGYYPSGGLGLVVLVLVVLLLMGRI